LGSVARHADDARFPHEARAFSTRKTLNSKLNVRRARANELESASALKRATIRASFQHQVVTVLSFALWETEMKNLSRYINSARIFAALLVGLWIAGCGGGSGGGTAAAKQSTLYIISQQSPPPPGTVSYPYSGYQFAATGGSPPLVWSLASGQLPPGLTLDKYGSLNGTPASPGSSTFAVKVTDSASSPQSAVTGSITITVDAPAAVKINAKLTPPNGTNGTYYGFTFAANGGYLPLHWSLAAGSVPAGITPGPDGSLTGTPTTVGIATFTITVTDSGTPPSSNSLATSLTIADPSAPVIAASELPTATVNSAYPPFQFQANSGLAPLVWSESGATGGLMMSLDGVLSGTATTAGHFPITLTVRDALGRSSPDTPFTVRVSLARSGAFAATGSLQTARFAHAATLLADGRVLVTGGLGVAPSGSVINPKLDSAEIYDPASGTFTPTGSMINARAHHVTALLGVRQVLVVGGDSSQSAELFDARTGTFTATGSLTSPHTVPTATLMGNGKVLVAGGATAAAELYDPVSGTFSATGSLSVARSGHSATLLQDGSVLVAGGGTATAELYNPASGAFTPTGSMSESRDGHSAVRLMDGTVLVTGSGLSADVYDPATGTFVPVGSMIGATAGSSFTERSDGSVLAAGGTMPLQWCCTRAVASAALFAPESLGFTATASLTTKRAWHTATRLRDGSVLVVGGEYSSDIFRPRVLVKSCEIFR
jgi:hypothetical protein